MSGVGEPDRVVVDWGAVDAAPTESERSCSGLPAGGGLGNGAGPEGFTPVDAEGRRGTEEGCDAEGWGPAGCDAAGWGEATGREAGGGERAADGALERVKALPDAGAGASGR